MWESLLKLSNSRAMLVGAVTIDTLCLGSLACLLMTKGAAASFEAGVLVLTALAITGPVLGVAVGLASLIVPGWLDAEERARRCILAGAVMHGGVQTSTILSSCCGRSPSSIAGYFAETMAVTFIAMLLMAGLAAVVKRSVEKKRRGTWPLRRGLDADSED